jgi:hypothetical protein
VRATNISDARITATHWAAQRAQFAVEAATPAMVVIAQSFYHNWRAFVDGRPVPLWRANHAFQALEVPAGRHEVTLVYQDTAFHFGVIISTLTGITCLVLLSRRDGSRPANPRRLTAAERQEFRHLSRKDCDSFGFPDGLHIALLQNRFALAPYDTRFDH